MPLGLRRGTVSALTQELPELVRLEVDGLPCIAYPRLTGAVAVGDDVLVNERARLLELGSGGFDVLYANLTRGLGLPQEEGAHVMALPYTPGQVTVCCKEEMDGLADSLEGLPVVLCTLHSQVAPVAAALEGTRVAYVQVAGGALPVSLSDTMRTLRERGLLEVACAVAPCLDGEAQFVTAAAALAWSKAQGFDAAVCALGGRPILALRTSAADARGRHQGVSHHAQAVLDLALGELLVAREQDGEGWEEACAGLPLSHMGRGPVEDPAFFRAAYAAGIAARRLL